MSWFSNKKQHTKDCAITVFEETNVIIVDGDHYKKFNPEKEELDIIEKLARNNAELIKIVGRLAVPPNQKPLLVLTTIINNQVFIMSDIKLVLGTPKTGVFALLDNKTGNLITDASFSNQAVGANSNPEFATFAIDPANPNSPVGTPVAAGAGTVVFTASAGYTDPGDGSSQSGDFTVTKNFSVAPGADGVTLDVQFN